MRRDYSDVTDFNQLQKEIEKCFKKWDTIYLKGSNGTSFVSDGVVLNMLRSDIIWLRKKRSKANKNIPIAGQMTLYGDVIQEEREIPPLMSRNYMNPNTVKKKEYLLLHAFD